jgi:hypothetical protein
MSALEGYDKGWEEEEEEGDKLQHVSSAVQHLVNSMRRQRLHHHWTGSEHTERRLDGHLAGCLEFMLRYNIHGIGVTTPPTIEDTPEQLRDKALILCLYNDYLALDLAVKQLASDIYSTVRQDVIRIGGASHPMLKVLEKLVLHQEIHIRRLKRGTNESRTKRDAQPNAPILNATDGTEVGHPDGSIRWIIFNPLRSDYDENAIDEVEGGIEHQLAIQVDKLKGDEKTPDPFGAVVSTGWCDLLQLVHNALHFCEYATIMLQSGFDDSDIEKYTKMPWPEVWKDLMGAYWDVSIGKYGKSREGPHMVARMSALRDALRSMVKFRDKFFNPQQSST